MLRVEPYPTDDAASSRPSSRAGFTREVRGHPHAAMEDLGCGRGEPRLDQLVHERVRRRAVVVVDSAWWSMFSRAVFHSEYAKGSGGSGQSTSVPEKPVCARFHGRPEGLT
jgi:hypothetical protein